MEGGNQLAIYKCGWGSELRTTKNNFGKCGENKTQPRILVNRSYHLIHVQFSFTATFKE